MLCTYYDNAGGIAQVPGGMVRRHDNRLVFFKLRLELTSRSFDQRRDK